ncbi:hypothetical protein IAQ61_003755 [Plenodomus lingam]|uniref:uncharacterized protein n=1 Tax=Leptosphaeria maculans TaxID=5022 RepID=UPI00331E0F63|nr:hypothetical protein IAQ61_003755 [Plenodomus lingam]
MSNGCSVLIIATMLSVLTHEIALTYNPSLDMEVRALMYKRSFSWLDRTGTKCIPRLDPASSNPAAIYWYSMWTSSFVKIESYLSRPGDGHVDHGMEHNTVVTTASESHSYANGIETFAINVVHSNIRRATR